MSIGNRAASRGEGNLQVSWVPGRSSPSIRPVGREVVAVVNFEPKRVAGVKSEVLVLGVPDAEGAVVLLQPTTAVPLGGRLF